MARAMRAYLAVGQAPGLPLWVETDLGSRDWGGPLIPFPSRTDRQRLLRHVGKAPLDADIGMSLARNAGSPEN